ncbi:amidohydrolase family protein [Candidatus Entotheonella palauensis]|uniref:amidohydrolase family protein n=1 Tax=Candidatus Entotheonella palauensis TaxID=93172 RepID=UPI0015C49785|nr:amidohydrolase family protein [Candidatus Entotheonella palauensis]
MAAHDSSAQSYKSYKMVSSDSHIMEPPDLWAERLDVKFRDRAPHVVREAGGDYWYVDGIRTNSFQGGAQFGKRFDNPEALRPGARFDDVLPGAYIPDEHVKDNEADGIHVSILYPTEGLTLYSVPDSELLSATFRAYNDWIADFCSSHPNRLKGIAMIDVDDIPGAIAELERTRKLGLAGAMITVYPHPEHAYSRPEYEPFWAAAQDLGMPLSMHITTNRPSPHMPAHNSLTEDPVDLANADHWVRMSLGHMIFAGVFERYPRLYVGTVEHELSWVPHFIDRIDYTYTQRARRDHWIRFQDGAVPSDFFHRNVFLSFQEDDIGIQDRERIGIDQLMWGSDYPHTEGTYPRSQEVLEQILAGVPDLERQKITSSNVARLYQLDIE